MARDPQALFQAAERAFQEGRFADARAAILMVEDALPSHPAVAHLRGLIERRLGNHEASRAAFAQAVRLAPNDHQIANNHGNLLSDIGELEAALAEYRRAARFAPGFVQAHLNAAITLRQLDRLAEAAEGFDYVLGLQPEHQQALRQRAALALAQGEADAAVRYRRAAVGAPSDRGLAIDEAEARIAAGEADATNRLEAMVRAAPDWVEGQNALARMRWEQGDRAGHAALLEEALAAAPRHAGLWNAYLQLLADRLDFPRAADAARAATVQLGEHPALLLSEAVYAGLAGDDERAERLFARMPDDPARPLHEARHRIRRGELDRAAALLDRARAEMPGDIGAWSLTEVLWRAVGDGRSEWLSGQPGLVREVELPLDRALLEGLAGLLRRLHTLRARPLGQSLREGTQTRHRLFDRGEPEIASLRAAIAEAVRGYVGGLPRADADHPLLRHRDGRLAFAGSWSVRLSASGHHVGHIHPDGVLSSACYISLPSLQGAAREGWLELGAPPADMRLRLPPLRSVEPMPGKLVLFPSYLFHGTRPFSSGERLTVAFDVAATRGPASF